MSEKWIPIAFFASVAFVLAALFVSAAYSEAARFAAKYSVAIECVKAGNQWIDGDCVIPPRDKGK